MKRVSWWHSCSIWRTRILTVFTLYLLFPHLHSEQPPSSSQIVCLPSIFLSHDCDRWEREQHEAEDCPFRDCCVMSVPVCPVLRRAMVCSSVCVPADGLLGSSVGMNRTPLGDIPHFLYLWAEGQVSWFCSLSVVRSAVLDPLGSVPRSATVGSCVWCLRKHCIDFHGAFAYIPTPSFLPNPFPTSTTSFPPHQHCCWWWWEPFLLR